MTFVLLSAGFVAGLLASRFRWVGASTPQYLNAFIINVALPAMILLKVPGLVLDANALVPVASAWLVILGSALAVWILSRIYKWSNRITGALLLVVPLSNSAYLGLPLLNVFTNDVVVAYGALYDQFGNFLALAIYAPIVVAIWGGQNSGAETVNVSNVVRKMFSFVPFPVLLVAVGLMTSETLPDWSVQPLELLAATMGPLAAFIVGFALRFSIPVSLRTPLVSGLVLRLLAAPALVWLVACFLPLAEPAVTASVIQSAMPSMITAGLVGIAAGFSERLIVAMLSASTLLSVVTLSGVFWLLS
ncbi:MAG: AEC family transporter [Gammaproteobacteria bacterium]